MKTIIFAFSVSLIFLQCVESYKSGAPKEACIDMVPQHGAPIQSSRLPYTVTFDKTVVYANEPITMRIHGKDGFKGFLIQVRQESNDQPIGKFMNINKNIKVFNCVSDNDSVTHSSEVIKNNLSLKWKAPSNFKDTAIVYATIAKDGGTYWVKQAVATLNFRENRIIIKPIAN